MISHGLSCLLPRPQEVQSGGATNVSDLHQSVLSGIPLEATAAAAMVAAAAPVLAAPVAAPAEQSGRQRVKEEEVLAPWWVQTG